LENAAYSGGIETILVSFSKDGLISASVSRLTEQALAIVVISGTHSRSTLPCPSSLSQVKIFGHWSAPSTLNSIWQRPPT
jgi:hypothetical protein